MIPMHKIEEQIDDIGVCGSEIAYPGFGPCWET